MRQNLPRTGFAVFSTIVLIHTPSNMFSDFECEFEDIWPLLRLPNIRATNHTKLSHTFGAHFAGGGLLFELRTPDETYRFVLA